MKYRKAEAKDFARAHMKGIWAAALTPFNADLSLDEAGFRANMRHWLDDLEIDGLFIAGKQGEFVSMSLAERKRTFELALEETGDRAAAILSVSDQNLETVIELARHAQAIGGDYIVVSVPVLHFLTDRDETLYQYYEYIAEVVDIAIAMWSHPDSGYLMRPVLCARIAEPSNIVAIKSSVPREMNARLSGDEKTVTRRAFEACGLETGNTRAA